MTACEIPVFVDGSKRPIARERSLSAATPPTRPEPAHTGDRGGPLDEDLEAGRDLAGRMDIVGGEVTTPKYPGVQWSA